MGVDAALVRGVTLQAAVWHREPHLLGTSGAVFYHYTNGVGQERN